MDKPKKYKIFLSKDALQDIKDNKSYILKNFKYREYGENFSKKIKKAIKELDPFAEGYEKTPYALRTLTPSSQGSSPCSPAFRNLND